MENWIFKYIEEDGENFLEFNPKYYEIEGLKKCGVLRVKVEDSDKSGNDVKIEVVKE